MISVLLVVFGAIAGLTIFLGLPVAIMKRVSAKIKGFLNAITIGVLIFILIEVLPTAKTYAENAVLATINGSESNGYEFVFTMIGGLVLGIFGLVFYEMRFIRIRQRKNKLGSGSYTSKQISVASREREDLKEKPEKPSRSIGLGEIEAAGSSIPPISIPDGPGQKSVSVPIVAIEEARNLAFSIAIGIGVHNFTEGLAIGQSFVFGKTLSLSYLLILGFAIHNSTEGFGIAAPMAGYRPSLRYLCALGLIGGLPTLIGSITGALWPANPLTLTFFLSLAAGALIYIISGMFYVARRQTSNELFMLGLFIGFLVAYATDLWLVTMGAG
jgi:ZIP family zinc transporter